MVTKDVELLLLLLLLLHSGCDASRMTDAWLRQPA